MASEECVASTRQELSELGKAREAIQAEFEHTVSRLEAEVALKEAAVAHCQQQDTKSTAYLNFMVPLDVGGTVS